MPDLSTPESTPDVWSRCLQSIKSKVQEQSFRTWFEATRCRALCAAQAVIEVPSTFFAEWLAEHYLWLIQATIEEVTSLRPSIEFRVAGNGSAEPGPARFSGSSDSLPLAGPARPAQPSLNPRYRFDHFVVGSTNEFPYSAARAVARRPGLESYNPLVLHGGVGLGKTHLLQAIGDLYQRDGKGGRVVYVTAEAFFADFIRSIKLKDTSAFVDRYRNADMLLIDDIQFYVLTEGAQRELLHTFNALYQQSRQIVLTSDCPPSALKGFVDRLVSRFQSGLVAELRPPDLQMRREILNRRAADQGILLPEEVACLLAGANDRNVRELIGSLNRLLALASLTGQPITTALAHQAILNNSRVRAEKPSVEAIQQATAEFFNLSTDLLTGPSRRQPIALARHVCMYLCKRMTGAPLKSIGRSFGGRDHSTVIHACRAVERRSEEDPQFDQQLRELCRRIGQQA